MSTTRSIPSMEGNNLWSAEAVTGIVGRGGGQFIVVLFEVSWLCVGVNLRVCGDTLVDVVTGAVDDWLGV